MSALTRPTRVAALGVLGVVLATALVYAWMNGGVDPPQVAADGGAGPLQQPGTVEVTYIANEGVLIATGDTKVLIDGLHREYRNYPSLPEPYREQIETARPPFDGVDLILVSHQHLDHFHPESVGRYLAHSPQTVLVSSEQVVGELEKGYAGYGKIKSRVTTVTPPLTQRITIKAAGINVDMMGVGHGSGRHSSIQNLGHLVRLGGKALLHLGDAEIDPSILATLRLDEEEIDVAILPVWFLTGSEGPALVREHIKPKHIVAVHMPAGAGEGLVGDIRQIFPAATAFTVLLERKVY